MSRRRYVVIISCVLVNGELPSLKISDRVNDALKTNMNTEPPFFGKSKLSLRIFLFSFVLELSCFTFVIVVIHMQLFSVL